MNRLLKVTAMTGLLTLLKMIMGFIVAKVVAVYTGPSGMAMLGQVQGLVSSFNGIINSPVGSGVVRFTAEHHSEGYKKCSIWWRAATRWVLIISLILIPLGLLLSKPLSSFLFENSKFYWIIILIVLLLPLSALGTLFSSIINGHKNYRLFIGLGMISVLISSIIMIGMIIYANIVGALIAAVIQSATIGLVMVIGCIRQPWFTIKHLWGKSERSAYNNIGGYMLMALTSALMTPVSLILIRNILITHVGWDLAGQWQAVWKISEVYLGVITVALSTYYLPQLASLVGVDSILKEINRTAKIIIPLAMIMALAVYLFRDVAIYVLFTKEFSTARELFAIQLCGDVVKIASWLYAYPMLSRGATKWFVGTEIFFAFGFVMLSYVFIKLYGVQGANIAYLINYLMYFIFVRFNAKRFAL